MNRSPLVNKPAAGSVLAWAAWVRALAVVPVLVMLWLAVLWAMQEAAPL